MNFMKKNSLCVVAALFGLAHSSVVVAEGAEQLAAEQSASAVGFLWVRQQTALWRQCPVFRRFG